MWHLDTILAVATETGVSWSEIALGIWGSLSTLTSGLLAAKLRAAGLPPPQALPLPSGSAAATSPLPPQLAAQVEELAQIKAAKEREELVKQIALALDVSLGAEIRALKTSLEARTSQSEPESRALRLTLERLIEVLESRAAARPTAGSGFYSSKPPTP